MNNEGVEKDEKGRWKDWDNVGTVEMWEYDD